MFDKPHGIINHPITSTRKTDYLYRVSLKCLIKNSQGEILVVRETGRSNWDLPGGGMDHGEDIKTAIAREMLEEVNLTGDFSYQIITIDEPALLEAHNFWQLRIIFAVKPHIFEFSPGVDGEETAFMPASAFIGSDLKTEQRILRYSKIEC